MSKNIKIKGARVNNLKNLNVEIPRDKFVVITGLSGSGKSSLAFDTIYAEGQRRYVESLSSYARQFLGVMNKPDVDQIDGMSAAISIDQKTLAANPRSTVGTSTEIYDYLRLLFARAGRAHCPVCGEEITKQTTEQIIQLFISLIDGIIDQDRENGITVLAPLVKDQRGEHKHLLKRVKKAGYKEVRFDNNQYGIEEVEDMRVDSSKKHTLEVVVEKIAIMGNQIQFMEFGYTEEIDLKAVIPFKSKYLNEDQILQIAKIVKEALELGNGLVVAKTFEGETIFSMFLVCQKCGFTLGKLEPRNFSFNSPHGACQACGGLGVKQEVDPELVIPNKTLKISEGAVRPWLKIFPNITKQYKKYEELAKRNSFSINKPVSKLTKKQLDTLLYGDELTIGILRDLEEKHRDTTSEYVRKEIEKYMRTLICPVCKGKRLRAEFLAVTVAGLSIADIVHKNVDLAYEFINQIIKYGSKLKEDSNNFSRKTMEDKENKFDITKREYEIGRQIFFETLVRLRSLMDVGLNYLTLDRSVTTLSGGEMQRIRLATQIGTPLSGIIYVLDEPTVGLHQKDNSKLIKTLEHLKSLENTVIVVEHDEAVMRAADEIIDIGPGAGEAGGELIFQGTMKEILKDKKSITGQYLSGRQRIEIPKTTRKGTGKFIAIKKASEFNLKNIDVKIPLGKFVCVTGVSGSGKSTLITEILAKALSKHFYRAKDFPGEHKEIQGIQNIDKIVDINQSPIGRTPRSNPATYTNVFNYIRELYSEIPEAKVRGYTPSHFSFNAKEGRCENCGGEGMIRIEMQFLPDVYVECEECKNTRYKHEILEIHYRGKNISDILNMTVSEAKEFFRDKGNIFTKLKVLEDVGLGYMKLGQSATTLSGGEAQRVKLATELSSRSTGKTLYILDEPTTGLHFDDIKRLLSVLNQLVDKGNTVLVIEHNLDVIKCADWVIDLGPEGGDKGGYLVAEGTPKDVAKVAKSYTGQYLKKFLNLKS